MAKKGQPKRDNSGKGVRGNKGRGGCKQTQKTGKGRKQMKVLPLYKTKCGDTLNEHEFVGYSPKKCKQCGIALYPYFCELLKEKKALHRLDRK